ncbi:dihydrodipicolinate synthase family protein [Zhenpiania hominis]|uniref:dihydrodipicolinate synthase family protein n=1 Tax=Zhenpiania hominis TaxID=2763644 RepID=UPI0039F5FCE7
MDKKYHGVIPPIVTPVDEREDVDEKGFRDLIEYCVAGGLHGFLVAGTNGETMQLTQKERNHAIQIMLDQVKGRVPVIAGVMDTSTRRVIENIKALEDMGGTCAAVTPIFYDRHTSQDETVRHFEKILKETNVDLFVYNIPPFTGIKLTPDTVMKIAALDKRIVGYKDSAAAYTDFLKVTARFKDTPFSVLSGATPQALSGILMGADGFVPALGPAFPEMFVDAYEAAKSKDVDKTRAYDELVRESGKILGMTKNATAAAKYAISLRGHIDKRVLWPQDMIQPDEEEKIKEQMKKVDSMYEALKK